jgi:DNA gyrase subunit B
MVSRLYFINRSEYTPNAQGGKRFFTTMHERRRIFPPSTLSTGSVMDSTYSANSIQVLKGLEAVRKRPGMYIGSTGIEGLHHLVYEVVDNSIDEALAGYCTDVLVVLEKNDIVRVEDNGRGIPVGLHPEEHVSALELVMTKLHAGGKFDKQNYKVSGGLHGVGVSVVNALSTWCEVSVHLNGQIHYQKYLTGIPEEDVKVVGTTERRGTIVRFQADPTIFEEMVYSFDVLSNRLRELAFLNKGVKIILTDERLSTPRTTEFKFDGGLDRKSVV